MKRYGGAMRPPVKRWLIDLVVMALARLMAGMKEERDSAWLLHMVLSEYAMITERSGAARRVFLHLSRMPIPCAAYNMPKEEREWIIDEAAP